MLPKMTVETAADGARVLRLAGDWTVSSLSSIDPALRKLIAEGKRLAAIRADEVTRLDTAGAWLIHLLLRDLSPPEAPLALSGLRPENEDLIRTVAKADREGAARPLHANPVIAALGRLGAGIDTWSREGAGMIGFSGLIIEAAGRTARAPRRLRLTSIVYHIEHTGLNAVPIIALINFLIGAVIAFMSSDILRDYGGEIFTVDLIAFSFLREFGVLLAAIMVAGRSGSAFTAEIGAMKGNEEIDAMRSLALDPVEILVLPRVIALVIALPILTFIANCMGIFGGGLVSWSTLGMSPGMFLTRMAEVTAVDHFWVGMIKAPFFAYLIAMIGCYQGFQVTGSAESVGQRTTLSVVQAIFTVIVADALFAMFFLEIGY